MCKYIVTAHIQPYGDPIADVLHKNSPKNYLEVLSLLPHFTPVLIQNTNYSSYE